MFFQMESLKELLEKKKKAEEKLADIKKRLGVNTGARYGDEFADQEFRVWIAYLADIEKAIVELKKKDRGPVVHRQNRPPKNL